MISDLLFVLPDFPTPLVAANAHAGTPGVNPDTLAHIAGVPFGSRCRC